MNNLDLHKEELRNTGLEYFGYDPEENKVFKCHDKSNCGKCHFHMVGDCSSTAKFDWLTTDIPKRHLYIEELDLSENSFGYHWLKILDGRDEVGSTRYESSKLFEQENGANPYDTWDLDRSFVIWLYEHCRAYLDCAKIIDLNFHTIRVEIDGEEREFLQREAINAIILLLESLLRKETDDAEVDRFLKDAITIWKELVRLMWW